MNEPQGTASLKRLLTVLACGLLASLALAQSAAVAQDGPAPKAANPEPAKRAYVSVDRLPGAVTVATMENGLTVIVQEYHIAPVSTVRCYVKNTGGAYETRWQGAGLSHLVEHLVAGGSTKFRTEDEIEALISTFGGATNAYTSDDITAYFIDCPDRYTYPAIELIAQAMQFVLFRESEFEREFEVVQRELEDGEVDRSRVGWKALKLTSYLEHPTRHPIIGYQDVLQKLTRQDVIDFYKERYIPNNMVFVVVGNVKTAEVLQEVAKHFQGAPRGRETQIIFPEEPRQVSPRKCVRTMEGDALDLIESWPTVALSHPDLYPLDVAAYILTEGDSSRLARRLKYEQPLALSVSSASLTPHYVPGLFAVFASCPPENREEVQKIIREEVYRLTREPVGAAELAKAQKQKSAEFVFGKQTVQDLAESLGRSYISTGDALFDQHYTENIQKVTPGQIQQAALKYFTPDQHTSILIAPPDFVESKIEQDDAGDESKIEKHVLKNGLTVLLKRAAHQPLVSIQAYTLGASLVESPEQAGLAALFANMLDKGTKNASAQQIAEFFDNSGGQLSFSAGRSSVYGSAQVLKGDFREALSIFSDCWLDPVFPAEEFENTRKLMLGGIARRASDPQSEIFELFCDRLPVTTPYHLVQGGKLDTVSKLTVADLKAYHAKYIVPQNMVIAVFGDIQLKDALEEVQKEFGGLPKSPNFQPIDLKRNNALAKSLTAHKKTQKNTGMVLLGFAGPGIYDKADHAALTVLDAIVSGYSYPGGWLHEDLRGAGLVYYVHAFPITGPAPGYFAVLSQTQPEKVNEVVARIRKHLDEAKAGHIEPEELAAAKQMILALHAQDNTTMTSQAQQAALDELYGLGFDYEASFPARIEAVSLEQVIEVARKYLTNSILVTSSPLDEAVSAQPPTIK